MTSPKNIIYWILLLALVARLICAIVLGNTVSGLSGAQDEVSYSMLGQRFAEGHGLTFPTNWYPWIRADAPQSYYSATISLFFGLIYKLFGYEPLTARIILGFLGVGIVWMIYLLARKLFDQKTALIAALIASLYPYLIFYSVTLVTETPFILGILSVIYLVYKMDENSRLINWLLLGLALSITVLLRMAVIFYIPVLLVYLWVHLPGSKRKWILVTLIMMVLFILPFTYHNYLTWNRFLLLEAQFGHVFWNGNHPDHQGVFSNQVFPIPGEILASNNDVDITNQLLRLGIQNVINDPQNFSLLTISRLKEFFKFWPTSDSTLGANILRVVSFGFLLPFSVLGLWISRHNWKKLLPIYFFVIIHTGTYAISWTMIRYRIPLDAFLVPFSAIAVLAIMDKIKLQRFWKIILPD